MNSDLTMLAAHGSDDTGLEQTNYNDLESLVDEEDLVCYHFDIDPFKELNDENLSQPDDITCGPTVEMVEENDTPKFVYNNSKELFPTAKLHIESPSRDHTTPDVDRAEPMFNEPLE